MAKMIIAPAPKSLVDRVSTPVPRDPAPRPRKQRGAARYGRMNNWVGFFLVGLVVISAVPVASNRPSWWLLWTMALGVIGIFYVLRPSF
jgi:hypothetical protein